jgi:hypothetical protein
MASRQHRSRFMIGAGIAFLSIATLFGSVATATAANASVASQHQGQMGQEQFAQRLSNLGPAPLKGKVTSHSPTAAPYTGGWITSFGPTQTNQTLTDVSATILNGSVSASFSTPSGVQTLVFGVGGGEAHANTDYTAGLDASISYVGPAFGNQDTTTSCSGNFYYDAVSPTVTGKIQALGVQFTAECYENTIYESQFTGQLAVDLPNDGGNGYYMFSSSGYLYGFGNNHYLTYMGNLGDDFFLNAPIVAMAVTPDGGGYWMLGLDGGIFAFGDAQFYGSTGSMSLNKPIVGMAPTSDGKGYWLVASDGGIFSFGDAQFYGSMGGSPLNQAVVGMAAGPGGNGYWIVASDGGIFSFGSSQFYGSTGNIQLNQPIVAMAATPDGKGYWFVAFDGGVFSFGDAGFHGSAANLTLAEPVIGMTSTPSGQGYWLVASDGGLFNYGDAPFLGSPVQGYFESIAGMAVT